MYIIYIHMYTCVYMDINVYHQDHERRHWSPHRCWAGATAPRGTAPQVVHHHLAMDVNLDVNHWVSGTSCIQDEWITLNNWNVGKPKKAIMTWDGLQMLKSHPSNGGMRMVYGIGFSTIMNNNWKGRLDLELVDKPGIPSPCPKPQQ